MKRQIRWKLFSTTGIFAVLIFGYTNCSKPKVTENISAEEYSSLSLSTLSVSPLAKTVNWGGSIQFVGSGGVAPYYFRLISGSGTLNYYSGLYTAPSFDSASVIEMMDTSGQLVQTTVYSAFTSSSTMTLTYSSSEIHVGDSVTLTASGGSAPYTYRMISGVGSISSNIYYASSFGSGVIGVVDAAGGQATFNVGVVSSVIRSLATIYRLYHSSTGQHLFSGSTSASGWTYEGAVFRVLSVSTYLNTIPLYRCFRSAALGRYLSVTGCSTYTNEGTLGYIFTYPAENTAALYSCFRSATGFYLESTSTSECLDNNYSVIGTLGYVPVQ